MAEPTQIKDMDAKQIAERHIVERYLANQLTDEEAQAFEAYVEDHPGVVGDIERIARMKSGLATLQQRGELRSLVGSSRRDSWQRPTLVAASIVAVFAVGIFLGRQFGSSSHPALLAATAREILGPRHAELPTAFSATLVSARGVAAAPLHAPPPASVVELILEQHAPTAGAAYSITLSRISGAALESVATVQGVAAKSDGTLHLFVRGAVLTPANYLLRVAGAANGAPVEYSMQVTASQ